MYEFDTQQNQLLNDLAAKMGFVGLFAIIVGGLDIFWSLYWLMTSTWQAGLENAVQSVMYLLAGFWIYKAAGAFRDIVMTEGHDIDSLMKALLEFKRLFTLLSGLLIIFLLFTIFNIVIQSVLTFMQ